MYTSGRISFIVLLTACCLSLISCIRTSKVGYIKDGTYYTDDFSVTVPDMTNNMEVTAVRPQREFYILSFLNDSGDLLRYEVVIWNKPLEERWKTVPGHSRVSFYRAFFFNAVLHPIVKDFPNITIISEKIETIDAIGNAYFAFIEIPEGATYSNADTGQICNSLRGYLLSFCDDALVVISAQVPLFYESFHGKGSGSSEESQKMILDKLIKARHKFLRMKS